MASQEDVLRAAVVLVVHLIMCDSVMKKQPRISDLSLLQKKCIYMKVLSAFVLFVHQKLVYLDSLAIHESII